MEHRQKTVTEKKCRNKITDFKSFDMVGTETPQFGPVPPSERAHQGPWTSRESLVTDARRGKEGILEGPRGWNGKDKKFSDLLAYFL